MLSDLLQTQSCYLAKATDLVSATIETMEEYRSDRYWEHLYSYVQDVAKLNNIPEDDLQANKPRRRQTRVPSRLDESLIIESTGARTNLSTSADYKINLYFPILDTVITELKTRFASTNLAIMKSIQACSPHCDSFLDSSCLMPLIEHYRLDSASVEREVQVARRTLASKAGEMETISDVLLELVPFTEAFPSLVKLLKIALTIAVSSSQCERCFSALKRIKSYLRSTMTENRLIDMATLSIERGLLGSLSLETVVDRFSSSDRSRRVTLS